MSASDQIVQLRRSPLLFDLPSDTLEWLSGAVEVRDFEAGGTIFRLGDPGHELMIIAAGDVEISVPARGGTEEVIARYGVGGWFGEIALLTGEVRSATARTPSGAQLLVLSRDRFRSLVAVAPELLLRVSDELSRRLRYSTVRRLGRTAPRLIVVEDTLPDAETAAAIEAFVFELEAEIGREVHWFDATHAGRAGLEGDQRRRGSPPSIVAVTDAVRSSPLTVLRLGPGLPFAEELRSLPCARIDAHDLQVVHEASIASVAVPLYTTPLRRLARELLARRVALVLGAGGAKGMCHIGVIRGLESAGIQVDLIVGASAGALIGGFAARSADSKMIYEGFAEIVRDFRRAVVDLQLFGASVLRGRKKAALLQEHCLGLAVENLPIPFHAVTADLASSREVVLSSGPLWQAIDAATSIPTIFPPVVVGRQQLVDGWMINPLPADVALRAGADRVIAVDPSATERGAPIPGATRARRSFVGRLARRFDIGARIRVAMKAMDVSARDRAVAVRPLVDVCLEPPLAGYSSTDVRRFAEIVEIGEAAVASRLPAIRSALASIPNG